MDNMSERKGKKPARIPKGVGVVLDLAKAEDREIYQLIVDKQNSLSYEFPESLILKLVLADLIALRKSTPGAKINLDKDSVSD